MLACTAKDLAGNVRYSPSRDVDASIANCAADIVICRFSCQDWFGHEPRKRMKMVTRTVTKEDGSPKRISSSRHF